MPYKTVEEKQARNKRYYQENKELLKSKSKAYAADNPEKVKAQKAAYNRAGGKELKRKNNLKTKYGITPDMYMQFYVERNGCCDICGEHCETLAVDHCHITEDIRGLLCRSCNTGLGLLKDDTCRLKAAINYLNKDPLIYRKDNPSATFYVSPANRNKGKYKLSTLPSDTKSPPQITS